jgi:hypothetical protein
MSRPVNSKTVEIRLDIFRARTLQILTQIYYYTLADFSSARSRVDGLHIYVYKVSNENKMLVKLFEQYKLHHL